MLFRSYLYNVDDLQTIADDYLKLRREELAVCEAIIRAKAQALLTVPPGVPHAPGSKFAFGQG